jgi:hypothetical protein
MPEEHARRECCEARRYAKISSCQPNPRNLKRIRRNTNPRRLGNLCFIAFASSVTTCSALRLRILTPSNAPIAIKARISGLYPIGHSILLPIGPTIRYNLRRILAK